MPTYRAPVDNVLFLLNDVLGFHRHANLPGFADATPEVVEAILKEGARFAEERLAPLNRVGDVEGCTHHDDGSVTTPAGFRDAYRDYAAGGWIGLAGDPDYGGQGLPYVLAAAMNEFVTSANMAFGMYPGLTQGAIAALTLHGSDEQKRTYLPKLMSGTWTGTMNLTEPQAGTDLGLLRTRATPNPDGSYAITGAKIFISSGEHDLTENIVHLVLARIDGAPEGTKGISLFVVPKFIPAADGSPGRAERRRLRRDREEDGHPRQRHLRDELRGRNRVAGGRARQGAPRHVHDDERGAARRRHPGTRPLRGRGAERGRLRPRAPAGPGARRACRPVRFRRPDHRPPRHPPHACCDQGLQHRRPGADALRRARCGHRAPRRRTHRVREAAEDRVGLLTPVIKGVLTDRGFDNAVAAQQVFGGAGYIAETGVEQFVRDARITMIYEGANGIQGLDLVGRKLPRDGGRAISAFFAEVGDFISGHESDAALAPFTKPLKRGLDDLQGATVWFMANAMMKPDNGARRRDRLPPPPRACCARPYVGPDRRGGRGQGRCGDARPSATT